jgi:serine/threonine protein kinase
METRVSETGDGLPKRIGRYAVVRPLSKGGMALVYEARREVLGGVGTRVAIKIILPDFAGSFTFRDLFINEARLGAALQHQNLVQILDFDQDGDRYFLVMEFVDGLTLSKLIAVAARHDVKVPMSVICEIGRQACEGLHYLHQAVDPKGRALNMIHRDIKPSNLMITPEGGTKILDFGISKGRLRNERSGSVKGTWGYMAPEQAAGSRIGPNVDVFSLGIVLYEMAARRSMFKGKGEEEIRQLLLRDHAARCAQTLDPSYTPLGGVLTRAMHVDPLQRFATAAEMGRHLADLLPDPVTVRDEMVRFVERIAELARQERPRASRSETSDLSSVPSRRAASVDLAPAPSSVNGEQRTILFSALVGMVTVVAAFGIGYLAMRGLSQDGATGLRPSPAAPPPSEVTAGLPQLPPVVGGAESGSVAPPVPAATAAEVPLGPGEGWLTLGCESCSGMYLDGEFLPPVASRRVKLTASTHVVAWVLRDGPTISRPVDVAEGTEARAVLDARGNIR